MRCFTKFILSGLVAAAFLGAAISPLDAAEKKNFKVAWSKKVAGGHMSPAVPKPS